MLSIVNIQHAAFVTPLFHSRHVSHEPTTQVALRRRTVGEGHGSSSLREREPDDYRCHGEARMRRGGGAALVGSRDHLVATSLRGQSRGRTSGL